MGKQQQKMKILPQQMDQASKITREHDIQRRDDETLHFKLPSKQSRGHLLLFHDLAACIKSSPETRQQNMNKEEESQQGFCTRQQLRLADKMCMQQHSFYPLLFWLRLGK